MSRVRVWLLLALTLCGVLTTHAAQPGDPPTLTPGVSVTGELSTGQTHIYQVTLAANRFVAIAIGKTLDDPFVRLVDGSGQTLLDSTRGELSIVTQAGGRYLVHVRSDAAPTGLYEISVDRPRSPTDADMALYD